MLTTSLKGSYYFYTHFTNEKAEAWRDQATCQESYTKDRGEAEPESRSA